MGCGGRLRRRVTRGSGDGWLGTARPGGELDSDEADPCEPEQVHRRNQPPAPAPPAARATRRAGRLPLEQFLQRGGAAVGVFSVVLADQRLGVGAYGGGDRADVAARVEVASAGTELILLDGVNQALPDAGARAHLRDGQPRLLPCLG